MSPSHRPLVALGPMSPALVERLRAIVMDAYPPQPPPFVGPDEAAGWLDAQRPCVLVLDADAPEAEGTCLRLRSVPALARFPVLGLVERAHDLSFIEFFGWGGEDLVPKRSIERIGPRLRLLQSATMTANVSPTRGAAIVADADRRRRIVVGRLLHNAGFDVRFALDGPEAARAACADEVKLVVADGGLGPSAAPDALAHARAGGARANWVFVTKPKRMAAMQSVMTGLPGVALADAFAPPENLLFVANELARPVGVDARSSARLLYGATVYFRIAGREEDEIGFTYNVSANGLYVRTLAPPPAQELLWLELQPPRTERRVRMEAKVMWRRPFGPNDSATVPAGFGVQVADGTVADLQRYREGYAALVHDWFARA